MIVHPETVADRGCWISDDRVYAFVSSGVHGIAEIGYHGAQPASRNARVFVSPAGVLRFAVATAAGVSYQLTLTDFDWFPGEMTMRASCPTGSVRLLISASGRNINVTVSEVAGDVLSFVVQLSMSSFFTDVHGRRTWTVLPGKAGRARFLFHDQILLDAWMKRKGPYGSDFLIPEPIRRKIFRRRIRSGLATPEDLLPEFHNSDLPIYDAKVQVDVGGDEYCITEAGDKMLFAVPVSEATRSVPPFEVRFDEGISIQAREVTVGGKTAPVRPARRSTPDAVPAIVLPGFQRIEQFFSTVPGLVESCVVRDLGIPRATPGGYYWIWAWDALVTALTSLRWGGTEIAERTALFVDAHRDEGCVPMRWTHALEPLDTQPPGALETLLASLTYAVSRERQGDVVPRESYARMTKHLQIISERADRRGLFSNIGFYPDLPLRFGRTEESTVAMEVAAFYSFCRVCENCALQMGDPDTARAVEKLVWALEQSFCEVFWDKRRRFFIDAIDRTSGLRNTSYPLFSLLFLHHPPALQLIRRYVTPSADFIAEHLLTSVGMRLLPPWDRNAFSETVSTSWYPHWDTYAMKLLRRGGQSSGIMKWLGSVELALERLGFAPEYLVLNSSLASELSAWHQHGSASNMNCATGWYQALLEGVLGMEFDPGGLTIVPLALPFEKTAVNGVFHLGTRWNVKARGTGPQLQEFRLDGHVQEGCLKVPRNQHDGGRHEIELLYGERPPGPHFMELANAEVLEVSSSTSGIEVSLKALGQVDLVFSAPDDWSLSVDGQQVNAEKQGWVGPRVASLPGGGQHIVLLSRRR